MPDPNMPVVPDDDLPPSERSNPTATVDDAAPVAPPVDQSLSGQTTDNLPAVIGPPSPGEWGAIEAQVARLANSNLVPSALRRKPDDIMVIVLTGRELAIPPMTALNKIHVIEGKPTISAELMAALVLRAGHSLVIREGDGYCTAVARRRNARQDEAQEFTFTMDDARAAQLVNKNVWKQYPKAMLRARAVSIACRAVFPDVLMGVSYVPEELGADLDPFTGEITPPDEELIDEATCAQLWERITSLPEHIRKGLGDAFREREWRIGKPENPHLPVRLLDAVLAELEMAETWAPKDTTAPSGDDQPAEGLVVGEAPVGEPEPNGTDDSVEDAEVVEPDPAKVSDADPAGPADKTPPPDPGRGERSGRTRSAAAKSKAAAEAATQPALGDDG